MQLLTLFEHQFRSFNDIRIPSVHPAWDALDVLNQTAGQELIRIERKGVRANDYVGVVRVGDITIQVLPKIDQGGADARFDSPAFRQATGSAIRNLLYLLSYAYDLKLSAQDLASLDTMQSTWFEVLTRLFSVDLHKQVQAGMPHNYLRFEDSLPVMRGRWDIHGQLLHHPHRLHVFDVKYDEFSPDIPLSQVFRAVVEQLQWWTEDDLNKTLLCDLVDWYSTVTHLAINQITPTFLDHIYFTRLTERFEPAYNLARLYLSGQSVQLTGGSQKAFAFMLDMNSLFERFITRFILKHRNAILPENWSTIQIQPQSQGTHFDLARRLSDGHGLIRLRPDVFFSRQGSNRPVLIADAKYKQLSSNQINLGLSDGDLYQMLAYATRLECKRVVLFYPQTSVPIHQSIIFENTPIEVGIHTINLHVPLVDAQSLIGELKPVFNFLP